MDIRGDAAAALAVLTRMPIPVPPRAADRTGAAWFPAVGALLGASAGVAVAALAPVDGTLAAIAGLAVLAVLTGALHLDGLADTADALLARDAARADLARRDPRIGTGGAVALVLVLAAEVASLASALRAAEVVLVVASLVAIAAGARLVPVLVAVFAVRPVAGPDVPAAGGFGAWFAAAARPRDAVAGALLVLALGVAAAWLAGTMTPALCALVTVAVGTVVAALLLGRRGGLDGDLLGASTELAMLAGTVALAILVRLGA
jgi:adenosylcobinamide-GDP ribazoletransferase